MPKKTVYRVGDIVRINNPQFVQRVGYPWDKEYVKKHIITEEQKATIRNLLPSFDPDGDLETFHFLGDNASEDLIDRLAYWILKSKGFGGNKRSIHTKPRPECLNRLARVTSKRVVKTGEYEYGYTDMDGEGSAPCLYNEKSHVLLTLDVFRDEELRDIIFWDTMNDEIEECNVEIHKRIRRWKATLYPNNQPPIEFGIFEGIDESHVKEQIRFKSFISQNDPDLFLKELK